MEIGDRDGLDAGRIVNQIKGRTVSHTAGAKNKYFHYLRLERISDYAAQRS
jgi:hypothetical protein